MRRVTDLSLLGWDRSDGLQSGVAPGRVARIDRGRLTVLTAEGERRVVPGAALRAGDGTGPAVGDWVALRGELAVDILPRKSAFVRSAAGRSSAGRSSRPTSTWSS